MNEKQELLLQNLKNIRDYWTKTAVDGLNPNADLIWSENEDEYKILQSKLESKEELNAFYNIQNEVIDGVIHSILVMIDGGDPLADNFLIDLIDSGTKESLQEGVALHEEFYGLLSDNKEI